MQKNKQKYWILKYGNQNKSRNQKLNIIDKYTKHTENVNLSWLADVT